MYLISFFSLFSSFSPEGVLPSLDMAVSRSGVVSRMVLLADGRAIRQRRARQKAEAALVSASVTLGRMQQKAEKKQKRKEK